MSQEGIAARRRKDFRKRNMNTLEGEEEKNFANREGEKFCKSIAKLGVVRCRSQAEVEG